MRCALAMIAMVPLVTVAKPYRLEVDASYFSELAPEKAPDKVVIVGALLSDDGIVTRGRMLEYPLDESFEAIIEGNVEFVRNVVLYLHREEESRPVARANFVLEPGTSKISFVRGESEARVEAGRYTALAFHSWQRDAEYLAAIARVEAKFEEFSDLSPEDRRVRWMREDENTPDHERLPAERVMTRIVESVLLTNDDPVARFVALEASYYRWQPVAELDGQLDKAYLKYIGYYRSVQRALPDNPFVEHALHRIESDFERYRVQSNIDVGAVVADFAARDLDDREVRLTDVLAANKYVLIEFWASWCGPCRVQIPHLKRVYSDYKDRGLEIISVSIDAYKEDWENASFEEELPWVDVGDQAGTEGEAAKLYGVTGIPANFLVDSSGAVVARHLVYEELDDELSRLFGAVNRVLGQNGRK